MTNWVDVRNFERLMEGYQRDWDGQKMPGLDSYLKKLIEQNDQIILLLKKMTNK